MIGGAVVEQVINGGLSSFSDPTKHVAKMIRMAEEGFMVAFSEGKISSFTYDANISTVPSQTLTAYSLTENDILRQAIIRYQGSHPDVYVEYKVGMDEEGSVTREDAVKKLNTEIMAGKGPDFLLMDGLPVNSYVEKGVLADLTPYLAEIEKEEKILSNIKESFTADGKICMIPAAFTVSMYMTDKENMTDVSDLSSLADMMGERGAWPPPPGLRRRDSSIQRNCPAIWSRRRGSMTPVWKIWMRKFCSGIWTGRSTGSTAATKSALTMTCRAAACRPLPAMKRWRLES